MGEEEKKSLPLIEFDHQCPQSERLADAAIEARDSAGRMSDALRTERDLRWKAEQEVKELKERLSKVTP